MEINDVLINLYLKFNAFECHVVIGKYKRNLTISVSKWKILCLHMYICTLDKRDTNNVSITNFMMDTFNANTQDAHLKYFCLSNYLKKKPLS